MKRNVSGKVALYGVLIALAMILSYLEVLIPIPVPVPGMKIGLANLVTVTGFYLIGIPGTIVITMTRILLVGLTFGNPFSMLYGFAGSTFSLAAMIITKKSNRFSQTGVSVAGGVAHNIGQVTFAAIVVHTIHLYYYLPYLLIGGCIAGILIGMLSGVITKRLACLLKKYKGL